MRKIKATLIYIIKDDEVLLGLKRKGFGAGNYNGVGGKVDSGETIEQGMLRECMEEICVKPTDYSLVGKLIYNEYMKGEPVIFETYVYLASGYIGNIETTEEIEPKWFKKDKLPFLQMFGDDEYWLPEVLNGKNVVAEFDFDEKFNILKYNVDFVNEIIVDGDVCKI